MSTLDRVPNSMAELLELENVWQEAQRVAYSSDDPKLVKRARDVIAQAEKLFDLADCWIDEDGIFRKEEK